jgi:hypothetical protein
MNSPPEDDALQARVNGCAALNQDHAAISEVGMNAALAQIEGAAPRDEIEGALAVQMACTHSAALSVLARFRGGRW